MTALVALVSMAMIGLVLPFNLHLQSVLHMSALKAGLVLAPSSLPRGRTALVCGHPLGRVCRCVNSLSWKALLGFLIAPCP
ncbi:hypothetical protein [Streptomyces sp. NPDC051109]|uniref:hypothetical protein n=1 Tax=Streptomyces sp. NPDC051109 TaxID=3365642 RepID=UPI0037A6FC2F